MPKEGGNTSEDDSASRNLRPDWWWDLSQDELTERIPTPRRDRFPGPIFWDSNRTCSANRLLAVLFAFVLTASLMVVAGHPFRATVLPYVLTFVYAGLWLFIGIYVIATATWAYEAYLGWQSEPAPLEYDADEVQVRILTIDAEDIVQETVNALPEKLANRHVIAEAPLEIRGADVHVVPDDFECNASRKGRALEWARQELACEREFVLFLDEDTLVTEFDGLPDADIVQFREWPMYTGSYLTYWAEVLRMGYQTEQIGFKNFPLYAWGGGIAVRKEVEDRVTWDFDSLIEDTVFVWHAVEQGADFEVMETKFRNQAPPSLLAMCTQRRRWLVGTLREETHLPRWYRLLSVMRTVTWGFSPVTPFLVLFTGLIPGELPEQFAFAVLAQVLFVFSLIWIWRGWRYYEGPSLWMLPVFVIYPVIVAFHSAGAAWGFLSPPDSFETTTKVSSESEETSATENDK